MIANLVDGRRSQPTGTNQQSFHKMFSYFSCCATSQVAYHFANKQKANSSIFYDYGTVENGFHIAKQFTLFFLIQFKNSWFQNNITKSINTCKSSVYVRHNAKNVKSNVRSTFDLIGQVSTGFLVSFFNNFCFLFSQYIRLLCFLLGLSFFFPFFFPLSSLQ